METKHSGSLQTKKFKIVRSTGKVMATIFWIQKGVLLVDSWGSEQQLMQLYMVIQQ